MRLHFLSGGRLSMRRRVYMPEEAGEERFELPVVVALIRHPQGNVLFDTGCHPSVANGGAAERWGSLAKVMSPIFDVSETLPAQLGLAGLEPGDIDGIVCSHLHTDHCGCNAFFPQATVIVHAAELAAARAADAVPKGYFAADWDVGQRLDVLSDERDLFGDGRLVLLPMPGHTPGMLVAHVALDSGDSFLLASDAVPLARTLDRREVPRNSWDAELTVRSLDAIDALHRKGATVVCGHDDEQWQSLRKGGNAYA